MNYEPEMRTRHSKLADTRKSTRNTSLKCDQVIANSAIQKSANETRVQNMIMVQQTCRYDGEQTEVKSKWIGWWQSCQYEEEQTRIGSGL